MTYKDELIKPEELIVGKTYKYNLLKSFVSDYECPLIIIGETHNVSVFNPNIEYEVKEIIEECKLGIPEGRGGCINYCNTEKIIIVERKSNQ